MFISLDRLWLVMADTGDSSEEDFLSLNSSCSQNSADDSYHSISSTFSLHSELENVFLDCVNNFNVIHINAQSVPSSYTDMLASFDCSNIHAILVSESWLKPCLPSISYSLPGFQLVRNDRTARVGGGVAIYLRERFSYSIISVSPQPPPGDAAEHLVLEVNISHSKVLLGVFYSPSLGVDYFSSFESILDRLIPLYEHVIIMGDFNTCMSKVNNRSRKLQSIIDSLNLHLLPLNPTHNLPNCESSLLDLIIVSKSNLVHKHGQFTSVPFSYHDLVFMSYKVRLPKLKPQIVWLRNFNSLDLDSLNYDASNIDWTVIYNTDSIETKISLFNSLILQLYDMHAPPRPVKKKHLPAPWLTAEIRSLINAKTRALTKYKISKSSSDRDKYKSIRNRCNRICRDAQQRHIFKSVDNPDPAKVWKFLRSLGVGKQQQRGLAASLNVDSLNRHFSSSPILLDPNTKLTTLNTLSSFKKQAPEPFVFVPFTESDVRDNLLSISSRAVGSDCVSRSMIVPIIDIILPLITHILNFSITSNTFPETWKAAHLIPLPKISNPQNFHDYRPISILPFLSKLLERLVHKQLSYFLHRYCLLNPMQSGFRPGHSTVTALVKVTDDIRLAMDSNQLTILTLLDFSNAFNSVDFDILVKSLSSFNISPAAENWFRSYLTGRRQRIKVADLESPWADIVAGVPQGGVLSPLLFSIFINSITTNLTSSFHLYADDVQIYRHSALSDLQATVHNLNNDLATMCEWCKNYGLMINPGKTQAIILGRQHLISKIDWDTLPRPRVNDVLIPYSSNVKNLGLHLDSTLSWQTQLNELSRKVFAAHGSLRRLRNVLPVPSKICLAQTCLLSILDYADICYPDVTEAQLDKLDRLQNLCIRFIFRLRKYDHISFFRKKLNWLPIRLRRNSHILHLLYSILFHPNTPSYLKDRFELLGSQHELSLRSAAKQILQVPLHKSDSYHSSFTITAITLWNQLPLTIRQAQSLATFKTLLKKYYLSSI